MEGEQPLALATIASDRSEVDTARPFRSVKEAVAVFGERFLVGGDAFTQKTNAIVRSPKPIYALSAPKPVYSVTNLKPVNYSASSSPPSYSSSSSHFNQEREDEIVILSSLKKLEAELGETKHELKLLKERETETEIAVASLNAELHKSMSRLAEIEAANKSPVIEEQSAIVASERWGDERTGFEYLPSLAEALKLGGMERKKGTKPAKKKPIIPLIGDIFPKKKNSSELDDSLYSQPFYGTLS